MTVPPQANAVLLSIGGGGLSEDYDAPAGVVTAKWQGQSEAYVQEKFRSVFGQTGLDRLKETRLFFDDELVKTTPLQAGDTVTYNFNGQMLVGRIADFNTPQMPGAPSHTMVILETVEALP